MYLVVNVLCAIDECHLSEWSPTIPSPFGQTSKRCAMPPENCELMDAICRNDHILYYPLLDRLPRDVQCRLKIMNWWMHSATLYLVLKSLRAIDGCHLSEWSPTISSPFGQTSKRCVMLPENCAHPMGSHREIVCTCDIVASCLMPMAQSVAAIGYHVT